MRTVFLMAVAAILSLTVAHAQRLVTQAQLLAGPWEMTTASGTHGIFLRIDPKEEPTVVRVYHRKEDTETVVSLRGPVSSALNSEPLRVAGLDVAFHADPPRWSGTWSLDGETRDITLERPHPTPGSTPSPLCGDWDGLSTRLHIVQSSDGMVTAWMDRFNEIQRSGELLKLVSADPLRVVLELVSVGGKQYRFTGALKMSSLSGRWNGLNAGDTFYRIR